VRRRRATESPFREARVEAGDRENRLRLALLEQQRGEERVVHVLANAEQRHAQLGLRFRQLGAFSRAARRDSRIHQRLLRVEVRVVRVVWRSGNRDVRDAHGNRRDRRLVLRLTRYTERRLLVRADVLEAKGARRCRQLELSLARIGGHGLLQERRQTNRVARGGPGGLLRVAGHGDRQHGQGHECDR
jgi:hypothetical protein